jgi:hypothetical protein
LTLGKPKFTLTHGLDKDDKPESDLKTIQEKSETPIETIEKPISPPPKENKIKP